MHRKINLNLKKSMQKINSKPFYPTITDVRRWTEILNYIMFEGRLPKWGKIVVRLMKDYGWCVPYWDGRNRPRCEIHIRHKFTSFSAFYSVLAHELIHYAQFFELNDINHGEFFYSHREMLKQIGIKLQSRY